MDAILEPLVSSPHFHSYLDTLNEVRRREMELRQRFRALLDEDVRAEFINGEVIVLSTDQPNHPITKLRSVRQDMAIDPILEPLVQSGRFYEYLDPLNQWRDLALSKNLTPSSPPAHPSPALPP